MSNYILNLETKAGTIGGTLLVIIMQVNANQVLTSAILAATGALVSFVISVLCKYILKRLIGFVQNRKQVGK